MLYQVGVKGHFTNHSLRASAATRLFEAGVDDHLITMRTGHSSVTGVGSYKRVGEKLCAVTSDFLNGIEELSSVLKKPRIENEENEDTESKQLVPTSVVNNTTSKISNTLNATARIPMINFGNSSNFTVF